MAHPTSKALMNACEESIKKENIPYQRGGTYVVMEGPQFSTLAESNLYRSWKADVIGMTNMPEAKLAREAEIRYASVSMVTDYDCWHPDHENVDVLTVIKVFLVLFSGAVIIATSKQLFVGSFGSICFSKLSIKFLIIFFALAAFPKRTFITC